MIPTLNSATAGGGLTLKLFIELAARHGFDAIEFGIGEAQQLGFERAAALFETNGILPATFGLPVEWRKDEDLFQSGLENLPELAKLAQDLGCSRCCTWVLPASDDPASEYARRSKARFAEIARILADNGIRLGLEFIGPHHFRTSPEKIWFYDIPGALHAADEINALAGTSNVGLLVDCFHWHTSGASTMDLASIPLEQIVHVHINDAPANVAVEDIHDSVRELPGATGQIDIVAFLSTLAALGYDGPVAVETFSERLRKMTPEDAATKAADSVRGVFEAAGVKPMRLL